MSQIFPNTQNVSQELPDEPYLTVLTTAGNKTFVDSTETRVYC